MGGSSPSCTCQPQLDLINKFHHLDRDVVMGNHKQEEVHHCTGGVDEHSLYSPYDIIHCGCIYRTDCPRCSRKGICPVRVVHAIDQEVVNVNLHIGFVKEETLQIDYRLIDNPIDSTVEITFLEPCLKKTGYYHIKANKCRCKWTLHEDLERIAKEIEGLRCDCDTVEWAHKMKKKFKSMFKL